MEEEKEFSFGYFMRYSVRRWFIILLCMILGAIAGALYVISYKVTNYEAWERSVYFDKSAYFDKVSGSASLDQGDYSKYNDKTNYAYRRLFTDEPKMKMEVFELIKNDPNFYPKMNDEFEKMNKFFSDFHISERTNTLVVRYVFDVKNDDKTAARRDMVQKAVSAYVEKAVACVKEDSELKADPSFADRVIKVEQSVSRTFVNSDEDKTFASNNRPSLATAIVVGVLAGFVAAMVIVLIRYAADKRVKSVRDLLPADKSETVVVGEDYADAYVSLAAKLNASGVKKPLVAAVANDDFTRKFASGFAEYCRSAGLDVELVLFGEGETDWHEYFAKGEKSSDDKAALYVYDGADNSVIEYISVYADGLCLLLNQAAADKKRFLAAVENCKNAKYVCTVVYNVSESWLD